MKKSFGAVTGTKVHDSVSKSSDSFEVRQQVTTIYPSARGSNSRSSALVDNSKFGDGAEFVSERVAFIKVPKGTTLPQAQKLLSKIANGGHIYRVMSSDITDVATEEQLEMRSLDELKASLTAINPETGKPMLHNGKPFYRATYWVNAFKEDIDLRSKVATSATVSPAQVTSEEPIEDLA